MYARCSSLFNNNIINVLYKSVEGIEYHKTLHMMMNKIDEMRLSYRLEDAESIFGFFGDFDEEEEIREYCWKVLRGFPDLNKEVWIIAMEGGDYIYSFEGNYVFITDDIWNFNLIAADSILKLLMEKIIDLKATKCCKNMNPETGY